MSVDVEVLKKYSDAKVLIKDGITWSCILNQTDIGKNNNKFYIMQIVVSSGKFVFITRYGRIGLVGKLTCKECSADSGAIGMFHKQFKSKTGNSWKLDMGDFEKKKGKYFLSEINVEIVEESCEGLSESENEDEDFEIDDGVKDLLRRITSVEAMTAVLVDLNYDVEKAPLGNISNGQIDKARVILGKILDFVDDNDDSDSSDDRKSKKKKKKNKKSGKNNDKLVELSSNFYTLIPYNCGRNKPPVIDNLEMIEKFDELLDEMANMVVTLKVVRNKSSLSNIYNDLGADVKTMSKSNPVWHLIDCYLRRSNGGHGFKPELMEVFEIDRIGSEFDEDIGGNVLLWHGSRMTNWFSIIKNGLILNPDKLGVYISGKMFGAGVYFASCVSKSIQYCGVNKGDICCLLLCKVALGKRKKVSGSCQLDLESLRKEGFDSTWGLGENTYSYMVEYDDFSIPLGELCKNKKDNPGLIYDEYIVYDVSQICQKYLVMVKV